MALDLQLHVVLILGELMQLVWIQEQVNLVLCKQEQILGWKGDTKHLLQQCQMMEVIAQCFL